MIFETVIAPGMMLPFSVDDIISRWLRQRTVRRSVWRFYIRA